MGLALYLATLTEAEPKIFAAVSALMNIQPSIYRSFLNAKEQVLSHIVSVSLAIAFGFLVGNGPIEIAVATVLVIAINSKLGFKQTISMAVVAAIFVLDAPQNKFILHAVDRSYIIFIGLTAALIINIIVVPPRYDSKLIETLRELNDETAFFFQQSVKNFIDLRADQDEFSAQRAKVKSLLRQSRSYLELYKEQPGGADQLNSDIKVYERYIDYNDNIYHSSRDTYVATEQRISWRVERGNPPITDEFKDVLEILDRGLATFEYLNSELKIAVLEKKKSQVPPINDSLWEELSLHIDKWHAQITGANYIHALMNVSAVAYDIKLASRGIKEFIAEI